MILKKSSWWKAALVLFLVAAWAIPVNAAQAPQPPSPKKPQGNTGPVGTAIDPTHPRLFVERENTLLLQTSDSDQYGYAVDRNAAYSWMDVTASGTAVSFSNEGGPVDDEYAGPFDIGFDFKFYEKTYSQVFISTNGMLTFGEGSSSMGNDAIPQDAPPNNYAAPFWDDLRLLWDSIAEVYISQIFYKQDPANHRFIVEWYQVSKLGEGSELLTFEAALYENGDILFQYKTLSGALDEATVGIEDGDGVDGLLAYWNEAGLSSGKAVRFTRPDASPRAKILPTYQGEFAVSRQAEFLLTLLNTGENGADTFDLSVQSSDPDWRVSLYQGEQATPLADHDGDGVVDSGLLAQGASTPIKIYCSAPLSAQPGDYAVVTLTARSSKDLAKQADATVQSAIPVPFAQAFADGLTGVRLQFATAGQSHGLKVLEEYPGSTLGLAGSPLGSYVYIWDKSVNIPVPHSDIEYTLTNRYGDVLLAAVKLTNNAGAELPVYDRWPAAAVAPDGKIGVVWVREQTNLQTGRTNSNVYFAVVDAGGRLSYGPFNLTANEGWHGEGDNIPVFRSPRVAVTGNGEFVLAWVDQWLQGEVVWNDIGYALYSTQGAPIKTAAMLTDSGQTSFSYYDPALEGLSDGRVVIAYTAFASGSDSYPIRFTTVNATGAVVQSETAVMGGSGWGTDLVELSDGKVLVAWTKSANDRLAYALLQGSPLALSAGPVELANPNPRQADYVSATRDPAGRGVLTWMDSAWNDYLYYALVDGSGSLLTPPMTFYTGQSDDPLVITSYAGQGNALYDPSWRVFLPMTRK